MYGLIDLKSRRSTIYGKVTDNITCQQFQKRQMTGRKMFMCCVKKVTVKNPPNTQTTPDCFTP
jgi:hypothetical protein